MKKENLDNQEVYKTTEQIRQSSEYAWLVDSLDTSFNDNLWTGLSVNNESVDKFIETVFGPDKAQTIPVEVKQQFYTDYQTKIEELRQGRNVLGDQAAALFEEAAYYENLRSEPTAKELPWEARRQELMNTIREKESPAIKPEADFSLVNLNKKMSAWLGQEFNQAAFKEKPELLDKTVRATESLWCYFVDSGRWQKTVDKKRNNQPIVYLKDTSDSNAKAVLLLIKKTGLENALLNNWTKPELTSDNEELNELNNGLVKAAQETSSAEVLYKVLQEQGILKNKDEALRVIVDLATKSMHYDLIKTKEDWRSSNLSLRGLHRALNQQQEYLYVKERINRFLELKKWRLPLNKKQQVELDGELLNEPLDKTLLEKIINNDKKEEVLLKLDKVGQEQVSIIKQADQVLNKSDEELIKNKQLIVAADWGRLFLNQHKRGDKSFGGAVAARAYGFDGFINYDIERGGYLVTSFKPNSDLLANIDLPGALKVNKQMVMRPGNGGEKVSLEQLLKAVVPDYQLSGENQVKSKEVESTQEKFEYNGLRFSRALNEEELTHLNILDAEVKEYITESVSQVIKQKYSHLNPVEQSVLLKDQIANGMSHPKILEQKKSKCLAVNLPLIIDK
ncbi:hypothetical protein KKC17_04435 [Patescibacteria group bacterium]|nr:hypothetical protein [Patescibacteria group bacterium]